MPTTVEQSGFLGLTQAQLNSLLDELDQAAGAESASQKRRSPRKAFRSVNVRVSMPDSHGNAEISFRVLTRNISLQGLAFLHHQMIPVEQLLHIEIPFRKGYTVRLLARVAHCRHVRGMIHEIGVEFKGKLGRQGIPYKDASEQLNDVGPAPQASSPRHLPAGDRPLEPIKTVWRCLHPSAGWGA
jgi:hypothetical protein